MALELSFMFFTHASTVAYSADNQCDYPSATKGGALKVEVRDFAGTNQMSLGRGYHGFLRGERSPAGDPAGCMLPCSHS